jgi:ubiquinone/menaquinone biosynthesis C-methylase UbiE
LRITGSEYLGREKRPGELVGRIRHEDALRLSFGDRSFDLVVSADVYEHVQDIHQALKETLRVLRDEGTLLFSVPFHVGEDVTRQRAKVEGGVVIPLMPEIYHGDPLSPKGSLVVYDFGWDILHTCRDAGFADAYMLAYYSMWYGYIGHAVQIVFVAEKRPRGTGAAARWSDRIPQP